MRTRTLCLIALGCPKNIVECELIAGLLEAHAIALTTDVTAADYALVHTCAFIADARGESIATIRRLERLKKAGTLKRIFVTGCFAQSEGNALRDRFPAIDGCIGTGELERIPELLEPGTHCHIGAPGGFLESPYARILSTRLPSTYVRISEGCNHRCSFCAIPQLRGRTTSRRMGSIVGEARGLVRAGIREINLIAQDTTAYGLDRYHRLALPDVLRKLVSIPSLRWLRIMYAYPSTVTNELIETIRREAVICNYLDMPLQHVSSRVLRMMRRPAHVYGLLERLKKNIPECALRTAFIVGFPGETDKDFKQLADCVAEGWFEHMGVFEYSPAAGTAAALAGKTVPVHVARERKQHLMALQRSVVARHHQRRMGTMCEVLVERVRADGMRVGRSTFQAPEVDTSIIFRGTAPAGSFVAVILTGTRGYDLSGQQVEGNHAPLPSSREK